MSLKTDFAQIFSCCPKNLSFPKFGGAAAPLAPPRPVPLCRFFYWGITLKTVSNHKLKQFSKPWITSCLKKSIKIKNSLFQSGDLVNYKINWNKISSLTRLSKKNYYHAFFAENLNNMKNTWNGINRLIYDKKNRKQVISFLKRPDDNSLTSWDF